MYESIEHAIHCPYCDEGITILVDTSLPKQNYIEDCQVCCRPMVLDVEVDSAGDVTVAASAEDD